MEMKEMTLKKFTDDLASNLPAPGGGSVAALSASIAASLASMVFSLTTGKKLYMGYDDELKKKIDDGIVETGKLKNEFLRLMDEDVEEFNKLMAAFKLPKDTDEEKQLRSQKIQECTIGATEAPLKVARNTYKVFEYLEFAANYGNPNAISDAGVGALTALTAIESAILNVRINTPSIKDAEYVQKVTKECRDLLEASKARKEKILAIVNEKM